MQWIRENLFLTCLGGVLILCIGAAYTIRSGQDEAFVKDDMAPREDLALRVLSLSARPAANKAWVDKVRERHESVKTLRDKVIREAINWNKRNYPVLVLAAKTGAKTEKIPSFPYDAKAYQQKNLTSKFTNTYRDTLYGSLAKLNLTTWPTDAEIGELSVRLAKDIMAKRKAAIRRVEYAEKASGSAEPEPETEETEPKKPEGVTQEDWDLSNLSEAEVQAKARRNATDDLMLRKANAGIMFISPKSLAMIRDPKPTGSPAAPEELSVIFPQEVWRSADAPAPALWIAQLNLWITQDILDAVDQTNQQSIKTAGGIKPETVPNAAIKQLSSIEISENYRMQTVSAEGDDENAGPALTQRSTCQDYEIVEYDIVVIMNTAHLPSLMRNLMTRGDHTVRQVSINHLPAGPDGRRYYGTDPVARVILSGEVLFRSGWTRKIMPVETLAEQLGDVLRTEDNERIEKASR